MDFTKPTRYFANIKAHRKFSFFKKVLNYLARIDNWTNVVFLGLLGVGLFGSLGLLVSGKSFFSLNENQILYFFSTSAQVIAGLFGLSITGYIFLRNELDREVSEDDSITEAVAELKFRYFRIIFLMTVLGFLGIILSLFSIAVESSDAGFFIRSLIYNVAGLVVVLEIGLIFTFGIDIVNPNKIEKISNALIRKMFTRQNAKKGDFSEFMKSYNLIEIMLSKLRAFYNLNSKDNLNKYYLSNRKVVELLHHKEVIDAKFQQDLLDMIKLRNYTVHSSDLSVDQSTVERIAALKDKLEKILIENPNTPSS